MIRRKVIKPPSVLRPGKKGVFRVMVDEDGVELNMGVSNPEKFSVTDSKGREKSKDETNILIGQINTEYEDNEESLKESTSRMRLESIADMGEMDNHSLVMMSWVGRKVGVKNVKKSLKELVEASKAVLPTGMVYSCCEHFDTYLKGGLYPILHMTWDMKLIQKLMHDETYLEVDVLGSANNVEQAVYREVASVNPPTGSTSVSNRQSVIAVAAFRSAEEDRSDTLLREWKTWTGARGLMIDILQAGLTCLNVKFFVKVDPRDRPDLFYYIVTTEVDISEPSDEGLVVDVLQRFRVERFLGFRTIYRVYEPPRT